MQLHFTVDPRNDSAHELNALSSFLLSLTSATAPQERVSGETGTTGTGPAPVDAEPEPAEVEPAKAPAKKAAPKAAKAVKAKEPEPEPEVIEAAEVVEDDEEEGPDYGKLRLEIRTRFADWAEQVGMIEGKALLDSFQVAKFSELDNSQLKAFSNKLAMLEADL
ncbi:hypothetical protein [Pseudomonas sp. BF-R-21]|uniref:hypothetical protein n=1 Tax=Pseudomonas sp. BF-R-21 TaxID=2832387 RepID=UPI001CBE3290|nr:hypothetical protein [Pseudomonas sp. BF-R-21]